MKTLITIVVLQSYLLLSPLNLMSEDLNNQQNVYGQKLESCCDQPKTGYFRTGLCQTNQQDQGTHVVCAEMTEEFLKFTKQQGNDLSTPRPEYNFPGLAAGDRWCLCALRWLEAHKAGVAPKINLKATNIKMLKYITLRELEEYGAK